MLKGLIGRIIAITNIIIAQIIVYYFINKMFKKEGYIAVAIFIIAQIIVCCYYFINKYKNDLNDEPYDPLSFRLIPTASDLPFYIPLNCSTILGSCESDISLEKEVEKFLESDAPILLLLGDSGSGKTIFCDYLYKEFSTRSPYQFFSSQLKDLPAKNKLLDCFQNDATVKKNKFVLILDGYDELGKKKIINEIIDLNNLNRNPKIIITCRNQYMKSYDECRALFSNPKILYIAPFSDKQIDEYLQEYVKLDEAKSKWEWKDYKKKITNIYNLRELAATPLLLDMIVSMLPQIEAETILTKRVLYEKFTREWLNREFSRSEEYKGDREFEDEKKYFFCFAEEIAFEMFKKKEMQIDEYSIRALFKNDENRLNILMKFWASDKLAFKRARSRCPIRRVGDNVFEFTHKSLQEYFAARKIYQQITRTQDEEKKETWEDKWGFLKHEALIGALKREPAVIQFLSEMDVTGNLYEFLERSGSDDDWKTGSAIASTILNSAKFSFSGRELKGVKIPGANLSGAVLDDTKLNGANLEGVNFRNAFLKDADLSKSKMKNVEFGERPDLVGHEFGISSVCFSADGEMLVSADDAHGNGNNTIRLWDMSEEKEFIELDSYNQSITGISFNPEPTKKGQIVAGYHDGLIRLWDISKEKPEPEWERKESEQKTTCVCFSPDSKIIASSSEDGTIRLWGADSGLLATTLMIDENSLFKGTVVKSDFESDNLVLRLLKEKILKNIDSDPHRVCFDDSITDEGQLRKRLDQIRDVKVEPVLAIWRDDSETTIVYATTICFSDSNLIFGYYSDGYIRCFDVSPDKNEPILFPKTEKELNNKKVTSICFDCKRQVLASGNGDFTISLWNMNNGALIQTLDGHTSDVRSICFIADADAKKDGKILASGSNDNTVRLWDLDSGKVISILEGHQGEVNSICYNDKKRILASSSDDKTIRLWEIDENKPIHIPEGHGDEVTCVSFNNDGTILASGSADKTVRLWDKYTGKRISVLEDHDRSVNSVQFFSNEKDKNRFVSGCSDNNVRIGNKGIHEEPSTAKESDDKKTSHDNEVKCVCVSPKGNQIVSVCKDNTIKMWNPENAKLISAFKMDNNQVNSICFIQNEDIIAVGGSRTIQIWDARKVEPIFSTRLRTIKKNIKLTFAKSEFQDNDLVLKLLNGKIIEHTNNDSDLVWFDDSIVDDDKLRSSLDQIGVIAIESVLTLFRQSRRKNNLLFGLSKDRILNEFKESKITPDIVYYFNKDIKNEDRLKELITKKLSTRLENIILNIWRDSKPELPGSINSICFNHKSSILAGSIGNNVWLWEVENNNNLTFLSKLEGNAGIINSIFFNDNGTLLAGGNSDHTIKLWKIEKKRKNPILLFTLEGHNDSVQSVCFSPDGKLLASGSADHSVMVWDVENDKTKKPTLRWTSNPRLYCKGLNIDGCKDLDDNDPRRLLLYQRGAKKPQTLII